MLCLALLSFMFLQNAHADELMCLAKNIYYEAGSESYDGKMAVAQVTINRSNNPRYPSTICGVVNQKYKTPERTICQFEWVCNTRKAINTASANWQESLEVAKKFLTEGTTYDKFDENVLFFHAKSLPFNWKKRHIKVATVGNHVFYRPRKK